MIKIIVMGKWVIVRFYNTTKRDVMGRVLTGTEYEQVGKDVDVWFDSRRIAKDAVADYGKGCEILSDVPIHTIR